MSWKIKWNDIDFHTKYASMASVSRLSLMDNRRRASIGSVQGQIFARLCQYKGVTAAVKRVEKKYVDVNRALLMEMKETRDVSHNNVARFIGACVDPPNVAILMEYCSKGSLQDILQNEAIKLDWVFRYSLIDDIISGMTYLHGCPIVSHGHLHSRNCIVDGRFVLKISDYGLPSLRTHRKPSDGDSHYCSDLLWKAPELLRIASPPPKGTQPGDVYSFAIIIQEIVIRDEPYDLDLMQPEEIIERLMEPELPPYRPTIDDACSSELADVMRSCWNENPDERPTFVHIRSMMRAVTKGIKGKMNIVDDLLLRMEQYANNLEALVEERTVAFLEEKKRSEELLYRVLPRSVAEKLRIGQRVEPEAYDWVTIYFSDIVGFTALSASSSPMQVETIGDAYMVVSGLPVRNGDNHSAEISRMALRLQNSVTKFKIRHHPEEELKLRIGIHTGPCVAGVVGLTMPRYCLFGDTVNTASRMESNGLRKITCSNLLVRTVASGWLFYC
ncbi:PREDICTED: atrial natriuretic peptide receptor 1-like [Priapulus caudatus]|uniref:Guanylate cyclase n=1 Tax=Priapulus caudatus TaxID=37621 RepID=A0ABM1DU07_PRICU|nr:PREDICTED: atrial natriuretic peptide receptor 1-like [Priapulus caudatus]